MNESILKNTEYVYSSLFRWGLKRFSCDVKYYTEEPLPDLDYVICSIVSTGGDGLYKRQSLGVMLGFNVIDSQPDIYYDKSEDKLFSDILSLVEDHHLIEINEGYIQITNLGQLSLKNHTLYRFYSGRQYIYEHLNVTHDYPDVLKMFPFYKDMGIYTTLNPGSSYWPDEKEIPYIIGKRPDELIKRILLQSDKEAHIYEASISELYDFETKNVPIRLYSRNGEYLPTVYKGEELAPLATQLLWLPKNELQKDNAILECLFRKLWDNKDAVLDYDSLEPYFELVDYEDLTKDSRTVWSDSRLFDQIVKMATSKCWLNISNNCELQVLYKYLSKYTDYLDWEVLTSRVEDDFLLKHFKEYPWDLEYISQDTTQDITFIQQLIVLYGEYTDEWDWKALEPRLERDFVLSNLSLVNVNLAQYTEDTPEVRACILKNIDKKWDWKRVERDFSLDFLLTNLTALQKNFTFSEMFDRVFTNKEWSEKFIGNAIFISAVKTNISENGPLSSQLYNQKDYNWTDEIIDTFESLSLISWASTKYAIGFECNPYLCWDEAFFEKYSHKVSTSAGKDFLSSNIKDEGTILAHRDFDWNWSMLSANQNITTDFIRNNQKLPWDWSILTERMFTSLKNYNGIGHPLFIDKWNWDFLSANLPSDFLSANLPKYANYWNWEEIIDRLITDDTRLNITWLSSFAASLNSIGDSFKREAAWSYLTNEYTYEELKGLLHRTKNTGYYAWDLFVLYEKPQFNIFSDIAECQDFIDWEAISRSSFIDDKLKYNPRSGITQSSWNKDVKNLITTYRDQWDFFGLSTFESLNDQDWFLSAFKTELDWEYISLHSKIFAVEDKEDKQELSRVINAYKKYISFQALSSRKDLDIVQIRKIAPEAEYDYNVLIANGTFRVTIDDIKGRPNYNWDWRIISGSAFEPTAEFLEDHLNKDWDWRLLSQKNLSRVWSKESLIKKMASDKSIASEVDWIVLTGRTDFPCTIEILSLLPENQVDWSKVSRRKDIKNLLEDFADYLDWQAVSANIYFDVNDIELLRRYADDLDWNILCSRKDFVYTESILEQFSDRIDWTKASGAENINFTAALVDRFVDYWDWPILVKNKAFFNKVEFRDKGYLKQENIVTFIEAFPFAPKAYHFTHMSNAVSIIKRHSLQSRNRAEGHFENSAGSNVDNTAKAHNFARFYFNSKSPTQFYNECLGKDKDKAYYDSALKLGLPKCPMPVFFVIDVEELLTKFPDKCFYSNGNMQKRSTKAFKVIDDPHKIQADEIFSRYNKDARQQEFLVEDELDLSSLSSLQICCYDDYQRDLLKGLVSNSPLCSKIKTNQGLYIRENKQLYFDDDHESLTISTNYVNPFDFRIEHESDSLEIMAPGANVREKGQNIYVNGRFEIKKNVPFKIYFEVTEPRKLSYLIYTNY